VNAYKIASLIREKKSQEVINFDGQTSRGTADRHAGLTGIHLVNAWSTDNGICLGQLKVDDKSNEITAVPQLMEILDLKGTIVTTDALNTQKTIASKVIEKEGDYLLPVKGNQPALMEAVTSAFEVMEAERAVTLKQWERAVEKAKEYRDGNRLQKLLVNGPSTCGAFFFECEPEKSHGRIEIRKCITIPATGLPMVDEWQGIKTLVRVDRERGIGDKVTHETIYYISSLNPNQPELIGKAARKHWGVESLHWRLDVIFRQDQSRYRDRIGARNLAAIRKITLNAFSRETSLKGGVATKQCAAACNPIYRAKLVKNLF
jgi:predicted transposase YbfD/YdcC